MTIPLGLRTLAVLALVAASTAVIVKPELIGGAAAHGPNLLNLAAPLGRT
jgi:hypothetical protein